MPTLREHWWHFRRRVVLWARDHYSDGSTLANVWFKTRRAIVPRRVPVWWRVLRALWGD
jgi:hypothetical protein